MQDPLSRIDLNLLVAYQVLMQEKNVTRAAERLFVTQPAMSKTLNRLRTLIGDELFIRSPHGLTPTSKTLELEEPINDIINRLTELVVGNTEFDPASTQATISLGTIGASSSVALPKLITQLRKEAPQILLISQNLDSDFTERLRSGSLDFAISAKQNLGKDFITHPIMRINPVLYMRKDHPLAKKEIITLDDRRAYDHIAVYFPNFESTQEDIRKLFASFGIQSTVPFLTTNPIIAVETLINSDFVMIASDRLIETTVVSSHCIAKPMSDEINLRIDTLSLIQHIRTKNSAIHNYFIKMLMDAFALEPDLATDIPN
jgi:DNA-binding transcriptional LysR family regulator